MDDLATILSSDSELVDSPDPTLEHVYEVVDFADELEDLWMNGRQPGASTGFAELDPFYTVVKGQWTVITGVPGSGKSAVLDNILVNMARIHDWKFLVCSPENFPIQDHIASMCQIYSGKVFSKDTMTDEEYGLSLAFIQDHFLFIYPPDSNFTITAILELAKSIHAEKFAFDGFIVDPYNELEHKRPTAMSETEYVSMILTKVRRFSRALKVHFWLVAHPTKMRRVEVKHQPTEGDESLTKSIYPVPTLYDISGSSHFFNKVDMGLVVWRDKSEPSNPSKVFVQKVKYRYYGSLGSMDLYFHFDSGRYYQSMNEVMRNEAY